MASLVLVSPGTATDGVTPIFPCKKTGDLFWSSLSLLFISLGCHPLEVSPRTLFYLSDLVLVVCPLFFVNSTTKNFRSGLSSTLTLKSTWLSVDKSMCCPYSSARLCVTGFGHTLVSIDDTTRHRNFLFTLFFMFFISTSDVLLLGPRHHHLTVAPHGRSRPGGG